MSEVFEWVHHPLRARLLQVRRATLVTPRLRRITLGGDDLRGFVSAAPDDHVRLLFPQAGQTEPTLPVFGPQGAQFPPDEPRPVARDYTPRRVDLDAGELVIDFVLHGDGPASSWAARAQKGDWIGVAGPRMSRVVRDDFAHWLLIADETGLPAAARWLKAIPAGRPVTLLAEVGGFDERYPLPVRPGLDLHWLHRDDIEAGYSDLLLQALQARPRLEPGYAWIAAESTQMRAIRKHLLDERGWPAEHLYGAGYWKLGRADHDNEH
jgi:NADPH-dependent ferric siderophore reductase